jgi:hypothetical protein
MQYISGITNNLNQTFSISTINGTTATINLYYESNQQGWFFNLTWNGSNPAYEVNGNRITVFPNLLRQYQYILPFGLGCTTSDGYDPYNLSDFSDGYAQLFILTEAQVKALETTIFVGN